MTHIKPPEAMELADRLEVRSVREQSEGNLVVCISTAERAQIVAALRRLAAPAGEVRVPTGPGEDWWRKGDDYQPLQHPRGGSLACAGIHIADHHNAIEFHTRILERAQARRDAVLKAVLATLSPVPAGGGEQIQKENIMENFKQYRRKQIAELRPYVEGEDLSDRVSVSAPDREAGSPKVGDMIARNPKNHDDQWLVAAQYFADNFEPVQ